MAEEDHEELVDDYFYLWVLIAQTRDALARARERDYGRFELTNERRGVLYIIERNGGVATPVEIARDLFRELHSVTGLLKRMEDAGLVSRHKGSGRSKVEVRLTDKGRELLEASRRVETDERIFSVLTKRERERLAHCLLKVRGRVLDDLGIRDWELHLPNSSLTPNE
jgi:DNA-binding MarR family transcriptional regulator